MNSVVTGIVLITVLLSILCMVYSWMTQRNEGLVVKMERPRVSDSDHRKSCTKDKNKCCPGLYTRNDCKRFVFERPSVFNQTVSLNSHEPTHPIEIENCKITGSNVENMKRKISQAGLFFVKDTSLADSLGDEAKEHIAKMCVTSRHTDKVEADVQQMIRDMKKARRDANDNVQKSKQALQQDDAYKKNIQQLHSKYCKDYSYQDNSVNRICQKMMNLVRPSSIDTKIISVGKHCGGQTIDVLEDGTPYGWAPPDANKEKCEEKCDASPSCTAFVWRTDAKCFWKRNTSPDTRYSFPGHDCHANLSRP